MRGEGERSRQKLGPGHSEVLAILDRTQRRRELRKDISLVIEF
jgi:hypothetical protein